MVLLYLLGYLLSFIKDLKKEEKENKKIMRFLNITGLVTTFGSWLLIIKDFSHGLLLFNEITIKDILELIVLILTIIYLFCQWQLIRKKSIKTQIEIDEAIINYHKEK